MAYNFRFILGPQQYHKRVLCYPVFRLGYHIAQDRLPVAVGTEGNCLTRALHFKMAKAAEIQRRKSITFFSWLALLNRYTLRRISYKCRDQSNSFRIFG